MLFLLFSSSVWALEAPFSVVKAALEPGGFLVGVAPSGTEVFYGGKNIPLADHGAFFVGFDRFSPRKQQIKVCVGAGVCDVWPFTLAARVYQTQKIVGVPPQTVNLSPSDEARVAREAKAIQAARVRVGEQAFFEGAFDWPVEGPISGVYGSRRTYNGEERNWHKGLDVAMPVGTPVKAMASGVVVFARMTFMNGNLVLIDHGGRVFTGYAHMESMRVQEGESVGRGEVIGAIGTTGRSTGPHLHMGLYWGDMALDPRLILGATTPK
jgi:hypothetical protein